MSDIIDITDGTKSGAVGLIRDSFYARRPRTGMVGNTLTHPSDITGVGKINNQSAVVSFILGIYLLIVGDVVTIFNVPLGLGICTVGVVFIGLAIFTGNGE